MGGVDEQLRLLHQFAHGIVAVHGTGGVAAHQGPGELATGEAIEEQLGVDEVLPERRHDVIVGGSGGGAWRSRQATRATARISTVTPIHLCHEYSRNLAGDTARSAAYRPMDAPATIIAALIQWSATAVRV